MLPFCPCSGALLILAIVDCTQAIVPCFVFSYLPLRHRHIRRQERSHIAAAGTAYTQNFPVLCVLSQVLSADDTENTNTCATDCKHMPMHAQDAMCDEPDGAKQRRRRRSRRRRRRL